MSVTYVHATSTPVRPVRKAWVLAAVTLGQFLIQLDLTIVNVALPSIGRDLGTLVSGLQWVVDGYDLALASLLLMGGRIGDRSGHKRVYLTGLVIFALGSGLCAVATGAAGSSLIIGFECVDRQNSWSQEQYKGSTPGGESPRTGSCSRCPCATGRVGNPGLPVGGVL